MNLAEVLKRSEAKDLTLTEIDLRFEYIGPKGMKKLAAVLPGFRALKVLDLSDNKLGAEGTQLLASVLPACSTLSELYFSSNNLGTEGVNALASVLPACRALRTFELADSELGAEDVKTLVSALSTCSSLSTLGLGMNNLGAEEAKALASVLPECSALSNLNICNNNLGDEGAKALASVLPTFSQLRELYLTGNNLGDEGAKALASVLPECQALNILNLDDNNLGEESAKALASVLPTCSVLRELNLSGNNLGEEGAKALASVLPACSTLSELYISKWQINDETYEIINTILKENRKRHQELVETKKEASVKVAQPKAIPEVPSLPVLQEIKQVPQLPNSASSQSTFATPHDIVVKVNKISYQQLMYGERIGKGSFGIVYQGKYGFTDVAIKEFLEQHLTEESLTEFKNEATIMGQLRHPNIVTLYGICLESPHYSLVMELMPNHSLWDFLHTSQEISWEIRSNLALDITAGLAFLHEQEILHRDLKSLNVLLDGQFRAKISDFGLSKIKTETRSRTTKTKEEEKEHSVGTLRWKAPELFKRGAKYSKASDVYSYGMVLWELSTRKTPYADESDDMIVAQWIKEGEKEDIPENCPEALAKVINECWQIDGQKRISAAAALEALSIWKEQEKASENVTSLFAKTKLENSSSEASSGYRENVETKQLDKGNSP